MRRVVIAALAVLVMIAAPGAQSRDASRSIRGRVVAADNSAALPRVRIRIAGEGIRAEPVFTDARGEFTLHVPEATTWSLLATKAGFAPARVSLRREDVSGARPVPSSVEGPEPLRIALERSSAINGRVVDPVGEPLVSAQVIAHRVDVPTDGGQGTTEFSIETDDLGEFRLGGLPAGRYAVTAFVRPEPVKLTSEITVRAGDEIGPVTITTSMPVVARAGPTVAERRPGLFDPETLRVERGAIRGRVRDASGRLLAGARVRVWRIQSSERATATDARGRFAIEGLAPGQYTLEASRSGYIAARYGQERANGASKTIAVRTDEAVQGIDMLLRRGSAVTGTVVDEYGEPMSGVRLRALQQRYVNGRYAALAGSVRERWTDDRGRFRLFGLMPGSYIVEASVDAAVSGSAARGLARGYAPIYHPSTPSIADAVPITVDIGRDAETLDFVLVETPVAHMTGTALSADGSPLRGTVLLMTSQRSGAVALEPRPASVLPDGTFTLANVPPGDYVLQASNNNPRSFEFMAQYVSILDSNPPPVSIRTSRGATLKGRMVVEGGTSVPLGPRGVSLMPYPTDVDFATVFGGGGTGMSQGQDGSFQIGALSGPRLFTAVGGPDGWYLKSVTINGQDFTDRPFDFGLTGETYADAQIVYATDGAAIAGDVHDERVQVGEYSVVLFSTDRADWRGHSRRLRFARPSQDGTFEVRSLPPGEYWIVAVDRLDGNDAGGEWHDPQVLEALSRRARQITLAEREQRRIGLTITRR